jgi:lipopolysaccharide biosynthesis protein
MFDEIKSYLNNLKHPYDLYVSLVNGFFENEIVDKLKSFKQDVKIVYVENKGVDIGGFLQVLKIVDPTTDLILKLHTKKGIGLPEIPSNSVKRHGFEIAKKNANNWFKALMNGVLSDDKKVNKIINTFKTDEKCGMVGFRLYNSYGVNKKEIENLMPILNLKNNIFDYHFIGGTIFWVRYPIIKKYFTKEVIDYILKNTKEGYVLEPSIMHAVERIFGYITENEKQNILVL